MFIRRLAFGFQIGKSRFFWTNRNWRTKTHPFFFYRKYGDGTRTLQIMRFEYWHRTY